jgi:hypothetical protein
METFKAMSNGWLSLKSLSSFSCAGKYVEIPTNKKAAVALISFMVVV